MNLKTKVLWGVALLACLCAPPASAQILSVQKVQACDQTTDIKLYQLNLTYNVGANTLYFYTNGESNRFLPNATAGLTILLYGSPVYSTVFDLCSFNQPFLCPIQPNTQFNITVNQTLPSNIIGQIPSFLFGLPDLGLQSRVTIESPTVGNESLCVVTTMASPGAASLQSPVAEWLSVGLLIGVIVNGLISFVKSLLGDGNLDTAVSTSSFPRVTDVVLFFQYVSYTGQMSLSYPELYRAFTLNFGWAMGLMNLPFIDNIVSGGSSQNDTTSAVSHLVNIMKRDAVLPMDTPANATVDACVILVLYAFLLFATVFFILKAARQETLFTNALNPLRYGYLYSSYRQVDYLFFLPMLVYTIAKALVLGLASNNGEAQAIANLCIEILFGIALIFVRPYPNAKSNFFQCIMSLVRVIGFALLVTCATVFAVDVATKTKLGLALVVLHSATGVLLYILMVLNLIFGILEGRKAKNNRKLAPEEKQNTDPDGSIYSARSDEEVPRT
ncbi:hypothetical protein BC943DRAFT_351337 [Umbelopsis sp. AD052]|nr:hypothetical protein BC943DRAFT_351337 [Umbelopsis sp. AD052]